MSKQNLISSLLPNDLLSDLQIKEDDLNQIEEYSDRSKDTKPESPLNCNIDFFSANNSLKTVENIEKNIAPENIINSPKNHSLIKNSKTNLSLFFQNKNSENDFEKLLKSCSGSLYLQELAENISEEEINLIFKKLLPKIKQIMCDSYGNYFLQKIIEKTNSNQRINLLNNIRDDFINISKDISGSHCIQTLIEKINSNEEEEIIKSLVEKDLFDLSISQNSTHVILKLINNVNNPKKYYIIQFCINNFIQLCINLNGSTIIKKFISEINNYQIIKIIIKITEQNYVQIVENQFGNYVIQYIFQYFGFTNCKGIINNIIKDSIYFSLQKYASNVIDKVVIILRKNDNLLFYQLYNFFFIPSNFCKLIENKFGTFVLCNLIKLLNAAEKLYIRNLIININSRYFFKNNIIINSNLGKFLYLLN